MNNKPEIKEVPSWIKLDLMKFMEEKRANKIGNLKRDIDYSKYKESSNDPNKKLYFYKNYQSEMAKRDRKRLIIENRKKLQIKRAQTAVPRTPRPWTVSPRPRTKELSLSEDSVISNDSSTTKHVSFEDPVVDIFPASVSSFNIEVEKTDAMKAILLFVKYVNWFAAMKLNSEEFKETLKEEKIVIIQRHTRIFLERKFEEKLQRMGKWPITLIRIMIRQYRKKRAVRYIKGYLDEFKVVYKAPFSFIVHRFLANVKNLQRKLRQLLAIKRARLLLLSLYWEKCERKIRKQLAEKQKIVVEKQKAEGLKRIMKESMDQNNLAGEKKQRLTVHQRWVMQHQEVEYFLPHVNAIESKYEQAKKLTDRGTSTPLSVATPRSQSMGFQDPPNSSRFTTPRTLESQHRPMTSVSPVAPQSARAPTQPGSARATPRAPPERGSTRATPRRTIIKDSVESGVDSIEGIASSDDPATHSEAILNVPIVVFADQPSEIPVPNIVVEQDDRPTLHSAFGSLHLSIQTEPGVFTSRKTPRGRKDFNAPYALVGDAYQYAEKHLFKNNGFFTGPLSQHEISLIEFAPEIISARIESSERKKIIERTILEKRKAFIEINQNILIQQGLLEKKQTHLDIPTVRKLLKNFNRYLPYVTSVQLSAAEKWDARMGKRKSTVPNVSSATPRLIDDNFQMKMLREYCRSRMKGAAGRVLPEARMPPLTTALSITVPPNTPAPRLHPDTPVVVKGNIPDVSLYACYLQGKYGKSWRDVVQDVVVAEIRLKSAKAKKKEGADNINQ